MQREPKFKIFKIEINGEIKLVRATRKSKAIKMALKPVVATIPTPEELVDLVKQGIEVEESND